MKLISIALRACMLCGAVIWTSLNGAQAAPISFIYTVEDSGSILNGATIRTTVDTPLLWSDLNSDPVITPRSPDNVYFGVREAWITSIRGASGAGAAWNGSYTFDGTASVYGSSSPIDFAIGARIFEFFDGTFRASAPAAISPEGTGSAAAWTDGTKTFRFGGSGLRAPALPQSGDRLRPEDFGDMRVFQFFSVFEGSAAAFDRPSGTFIAAIPLPAGFPLVLTGLAGLVLLRRAQR